MKYINTFENYNKYQDPIYRKAMDIFDVPIDFIFKYREFDRFGDDKIYDDDYLESLTNDIKQNGIKNPIKLYIDGGKALIIEGNHRLYIAKKLGYDTIPVQVDYGKINKDKAKPINFNSAKWGIGLFD